MHRFINYDKAVTLKRWRLSLGALLILVSGCASTIPTTPIPTLTPPPYPYSREKYLLDQKMEKPNFISDTNNGNFGPEAFYFACVSINHKPFWEKGDETHNTHAAIEHSLVIWVDGQPSQPDITEYPSEIVVSGQGSFGGTDVCARVPDPSPGLHTAKIEFQNLRDEVFSYEWIFQIIEVEQP